MADHAAYPLSLRLAGRRAVVVGGGPVAARRATGLGEAGADLVVVAPLVCEAMAELLDELLDAGRAAWEPRASSRSEIGRAHV